MKITLVADYQHMGIITEIAFRFRKGFSHYIVYSDKEHSAALCKSLYRQYSAAGIGYTHFIRKLQLFAEE